MRKLWLLLLVLLVPVVVYAQADTLPIEPLWQQIIEALIPLMTMFAVWFIRFVVPKIPPVALPILAAGLGVALHYLDATLTHGGFSPFHGLLLGAAAVWIREVMVHAGFSVSVAK